jgi:hypothetical protein
MAAPHMASRDNGALEGDLSSAPPGRRENLLCARIASPIGRNEKVGQAAKPNSSSAKLTGYPPQDRGENGS